MKITTMWTIRADMRYHRHDLPDWVGMNSDQCDYMPDWNSYLPYRGWSIDLHTKFLYLPVANYDFPHTISSCSFLCSIQPSPKNTKFSHRCRSLYATIMSLQRVEYTLSTAYTEYCIIPRSTVSRSQPVSHLPADHVVLNSLHSHNDKSTNE